MITGTVNSSREAILRLKMHNTHGQEYERDAVVDTGFDGCLSLPPDFIQKLGLQRQRSRRAIPADGSETLFGVYEVMIIWDDQKRTVPIYEMDAEPLLGLSLMYGFELILPILDGAEFTLRSISER